MLLNIESSILKSRKLILVGYDIKYGLQVLRHLGFNETSVINILDSQQIACNILSTEPRTLDNLGRIQISADQFTLRRKRCPLYFTASAVVSDSF
jgi:hypothetical protein